MTHDLIIIGGGIAGLSTAVQAVDNGLTPLVLEKGEAPDYPCNARWSGGVIHVAEKDMRAPKDDIVATIDHLTDGAGRAGLVAAHLL